MKFPVTARLKDQTPVELFLATEADVPAVEALFQVIVEEGLSYPHQLPLTVEDVREYWFRGASTVVAYLAGRAHNGPLLGVFYLRPNWPGRARRVANAGFMVAPEWRRKGLGWLLGATMLDYAKSLGYRSVLFNLVFAQNVAARTLWTRLGFRDLATVPHAIDNDDGTTQDAIVMFRSLLDQESSPS
ncbi:MAG: N-acetyltransferase [Nitrospirae bacterium]|nr:MAG: N-acetyltransferase [Nitrospirota bacterium]